MSGTPRVRLHGWRRYCGFLLVAATVATGCAADPNTERIDPVDRLGTPVEPSRDRNLQAAGEADEPDEPNPNAEVGTVREPQIAPVGTTVSSRAGWRAPADDETSRRLASVDIELELVASVESAVDLAVRPGDPALYVVEQAGRVIRIGADRSTVVADVSGRLIGHRNEQGLTGLEFSTDGTIAWTHETSPEGATTIREVPVGVDGTFELDRQRTILDVGGPPGVNHNSGDLLLAPDGTLLISLGDGESARPTPNGGRRAAADPYRFAHDPASLRGSILRIRPTPGTDLRYQIPDDNPFSAGPLPAPDGASVTGRPEVWAWGLRNPWKLHLDPVENTLWIADVGESLAEEINVVGGIGEVVPGRGLDFGWSRLEGTKPRNADVSTLVDPPVEPLLSYDHDGLRCAISGGAVYRGEAIPALRGGYLFGDFCEGSLWVLDPALGTARRLLGEPTGEGGVPGLAGVRTGPDGELYVLSWFGDVHRIVGA